VKLTPKLKKQIDEMSLRNMLIKNRFSPAGDPLFQGESGRYFLQVLSKKRNEDPNKFAQISKDIGWL